MSEATIVQHDEAAERGVLGSMMVTERAIDAVLAGPLEAEHFFRPRHQRIFRAIAGMATRVEAVDVLTVCNELGPASLSEVGGADYVHELATETAIPGNAGRYAEIVVAKASWRHRRQALSEASEAVLSEDEKALNDAMARLHADALEAEFEFDSEAIADALMEMAEGKSSDELLDWPYRRLNQLRQIRRGNLVVLTGPSHHGKSLMAYAMLDHLHKQGKSVHLYPNEMNADEIGTQSMWRRAGIPTDRLEQGQLTAEQNGQMLKTINEWGGHGWGVTEIHGWNVERVANHIQRHRRDLVVVDILHNFEYEHERELDHIVSALQIAAKRANTAVVLVAHINRNRASMSASAEVPKPTAGDLRGSGGIYNRADIVCCIWREQDAETAEPLEDGVIYLIKARRGKLGGFPMRFREERGRFEPVDKRPEPTDKYLHDPEEGRP